MTIQVQPFLPHLQFKPVDAGLGLSRLPGAVVLHNGLRASYSSGVGRLVELQVSDEDLTLRLALRSVDAGRGPGRGRASSSLVSRR